MPNNLILDGSKKQTLANFENKYRQCDCHVKQIELYSPWCNTCEVAIKTARLASRRNLRRSKCPRVLLDDCIERQCYIRSFIAHDIYALHEKTPETLINGETPDISEFAEFNGINGLSLEIQELPTLMKTLC